MNYDRGYLNQLSALRDERLPTRLAEQSSTSPISAATRFNSPMPFPSRRMVSAARRVSSVTWSASRNQWTMPPAGLCTRYGNLGEWHSHPRLLDARPSETDIAQLANLSSEFAADGLSGLMTIAANFGDFSLLSYDPSTREREGRSLRSTILTTR